MILHTVALGNENIAFSISNIFYSFKLSSSCKPSSLEFNIVYFFMFRSLVILTLAVKWIPYHGLCSYDGRGDQESREPGSRETGSREEQLLVQYYQHHHPGHTIPSTVHTKDKTGEFQIHVQINIKITMFSIVCCCEVIIKLSRIFCTRRM